MVDLSLHDYLVRLLSEVFQNLYRVADLYKVFGGGEVWTALTPYDRTPDIGITSRGGLAGAIEVKTTSKEEYIRPYLANAERKMVWQLGKKWKRNNLIIRDETTKIIIIAVMTNNSSNEAIRINARMSQKESEDKEVLTALKLFEKGAINQEGLPFKKPTLKPPTVENLAGLTLRQFRLFCIYLFTSLNRELASKKTDYRKKDKIAYYKYGARVLWNCFLSNWSLALKMEGKQLEEQESCTKFYLENTIGLNPSLSFIEFNLRSKVFMKEDRPDDIAHLHKELIFYHPDLCKKNEILLLETLVRINPLNVPYSWSKKQIHEMTGIGPTSIKSLLDDLDEKGFLIRHQETNNYTPAFQIRSGRLITPIRSFDFKSKYREERFKELVGKYEKMVDTSSSSLTGTGQDELTEFFSMVK